MAKKPVHEVRFGRIRAAIWENEAPNGIVYNVTLIRSYRDGEQWKDSTSFGRDDLPLVAKVADLCHTWIFQHKPDDNGNHSGNRQYHASQGVS
ncbi:MAG: hypothetical protein ACYC6Y_28440 [Thermoguttaceae bacterium]